MFDGTGIGAQAKAAGEAVRSELDQCKDRIRAVIDQVKTDDQEHLDTYGQHLQGSVVTVAEMFEAALDGGGKRGRQH